MLRNKKLFYYSSVLAGGCYCLRYLNKAEKVHCEIHSNEKGEDSTFFSVPEISEYCFEEEDVSQKLQGSYHKIPHYWRLLMLSKSKKRSDRHRAVKLLSNLNSLEKWDYMMISQASGPSTAIGLARSSRVHQRFFISPPFRRSEMSDVCQGMLDLISSLPRDEMDPSVQLLLEKAKKIAYRILDMRNPDLNEEPENLMDIYHSERKKKQTLMFVELCLEIVFNHSAIKSHKVMMVKKGILKLFWDVLECTQHPTILQSLVAQILSNFALEKELKQYFHNTGWIGILAAWSRSSHTDVSLPSAKALANLDDDDYNYCSYETDIYLLHPIDRLGDRKLDADVIFIHGINGATFWTWRQSDSMKKFIKDYYPDDSNILDLSSLINHHLNSYTFCWPK